MASPKRSVGFVLLLALTSLALATVDGGRVDDVDRARPLSSLSLHGIEERLQTCSIVRHLNAEKLASSSGTTTFVSRILAVLFPAAPAVNALLATLYISGPPNFLLALCPTTIDPSSLSTMVAFAVGGLLGDTLFHLLPEIFLGEDSPESVRFVLVEPNRNLLLGVAIMIGFMTFVAMDKASRIAAGDGEGHGHGHGHDHPTALEKPEAISTSIDASTGQVKLLKASKDAPNTAKGADVKETSPSARLGGYLNLIADFTHNITDGLAMSASFYASPTIGATTTVAVFFHEIPHEVGDFALLVQSGFSKRAAMGAQFVTASGALLGTLIGIAVQEYGGPPSSDSTALKDGIWGTSLTWGDMLLPFTAGTFLYVATVAVIPELLETGPEKAVELRKAVVQFAAVAFGAGIMLYISWD